MPTIQDFDDDTDFDLPVPPPATGGPSSSAGIPGMPNLSPEQMQAFQQMMSQGGRGAAGMGLGGGPSSGAVAPSSAPAEAKEWISLYPIYFDARRSHKTGERRVAWEKSCLYPHSLGLAKALHKLGLKAVHEPGKTHPRDWENPGRVKVRVFDEEGKVVAAVGGGKKVENRRQLLDVVAPALQQFCGGPPPLELPKREKQTPRTKRKTEMDATKMDRELTKSIAPSSKPGSSKIKPSKQASTVTISPSSDKKDVTTTSSNKTSKGPRLPNAGSSQRLAKLNRNYLLRSHLPPAHVRLPPHSPALSANLLNMDLNQAMGGAPGEGDGDGTRAGAGAGGPNPMGALGSMMGNLGFGQEADEDHGGETAQTEEEKRKAQTDPFKGMGRRGRKRVVRIGR